MNDKLSAKVLLRKMREHPQLPQVYGEAQPNSWLRESSKHPRMEKSSCVIRLEKMQSTGQKSVLNKVMMPLSEA